jgi:hypothetical protein
MVDLGTVESLARLQLAARRCDLELRLRHVPDELRELITFFGLGEALRLEPRGQAEEREQRVRVEEERELDDPPA